MYFALINTLTTHAYSLLLLAFALPLKLPTQNQDQSCSHWQIRPQNLLQLNTQFFPNWLELLKILLILCLILDLGFNTYTKHQLC